MKLMYPFNDDADGDMIIMCRPCFACDTKIGQEVKVTVTRKWYAALNHPKMHSQTKFGIPTSKNIGDKH